MIFYPPPPPTQSPRPPLMSNPGSATAKTTTLEFLIGQRVVLNEHVWAELDRRRGPRRDNVSYGGRRNLLLELT